MAGQAPGRWWNGQAARGLSPEKCPPSRRPESTWSLSFSLWGCAQHGCRLLLTLRDSTHSLVMSFSTYNLFSLWNLLSNIGQLEFLFLDRFIEGEDGAGLWGWGHSDSSPAMPGSTGQPTGSNTGLPKYLFFNEIVTIKALSLCYWNVIILKRMSLYMF